MQAIMAVGKTIIKKAKAPSFYAKSEYWDINRLKLWDKNPRSIKDNRFAELKNRLERLGQTKPLRVTKNGTVIGGNMRLRAMQELGVKEVWVSISEATTDKEIFDEALTDNEEFGYYEEEQLAELALDIGFTPLELQSYEISLGKPTTLDLLIDKFGPEVEEDEVPEVDEVNPPESVLGEVYQLGKHRLMCGSATEQGDVELLMDGAKADMVFTDPPYSVSYADKNIFLNEFDKGNQNQNQIENDHLSTEQTAEEIWKPAFANMLNGCTDKASYYMTAPQGGDQMMMMMSLIASGWQVKHELIWVKNNHVLGRADYNYKHEPIIYGWKQKGTHEFYGDGKDKSVWEIDKPNSSKDHPTMKPLELCAKAIKNSSKQNDIVLDLFGGSGSTLIACEQTNRICYMMELDPKYCDVIRKRYAKHTGNEEDWQDATPVLTEIKELEHASR